MPFQRQARAISIRKVREVADASIGRDVFLLLVDVSNEVSITIKPLYECAHLATAGGLVAAGLSITALPRLALPIVMTEGLASRPLSAPFLVRSIGVVTRAGQPLTQSGQILLSALEAETRLWKRRSDC